MVMLKVLAAELFPLEALTVNVEVPADVGVPEITPAVVSESPAGRLPELRLHAALLTEEASCARYSVPAVPDGSEAVVMVIVVVGVVSAGDTVMVSCRVPEAEFLAALTVNVELPADVGVPEITPVEEFRLNPDGRDPELTDQVTPDSEAASAAE